MLARLVLASTAVALAAGGDAACSTAAECESEETGLLQQRSAAKQRAAPPAPSLELTSRKGSFDLRLLQWNVGHPTTVEPNSLAYVGGTLSESNVPVVDFFNVVNLAGIEPPAPFKQVPKNCSKTSKKADLTTLIYNSERWQLQGQAVKFCLSSGGEEGEDPAVVAKFKSQDGGPNLVVVGAHFETSTVFLGAYSTEFATLKAKLDVPAGYKVVLLADTNAFEWSPNAKLAEASGFEVGVDTPTRGATCCQPLFVWAPGLGYWSADRIITSLGGTVLTGVEILPLADNLAMTLTHKPIAVTLSIAG